MEVIPWYIGIVLVDTSNETVLNNRMMHFFHSFLPAYFEWWHIPFLFVAGLVGESFGALVGGGSLVTLPAILFVGVPIQSGIAINNASSLGTEVGILSETYKKVIANKKLVLLMMIPVTLGGVVGTWLLLTLSADVIKYVMVVSVVLILGYTFFSKDKPDPNSTSKIRYAILAVFLFLVGLYTNFIGVGEGTFGKIALMSVLGLSFMQSQGIKSTATMPTRIYSLIVTAFAGLIIWPYLLTKWCANFLAGKYATRFVKKLPDSYLKVALTIVSLGFVAYLLFFY